MIDLVSNSVSNRKVFSYGLVAMLVLVGFTMLIPVQEGSAMTGTGSAGDPFVIYNVDDLQDMDIDLGGYYVLANDIDASATAGWNGGEGFEPVGSSGTPFTGTFNGDGYAVSGLFIDRPTTDYVGLFGHTSSTATISSTILVDSNMTGEDYVGGIVGYNNGGTLTNNTAHGNTTGTGERVGGLVGRNDDGGTLTNNTAHGNTTGTNRVGGLVGHNSDVLTNNTAHGNTTGTGLYVGGLVGVNVGGVAILNNNTAHGTTTGTNRVGGLVGWNDGGTLTNSTNYGYTNGTGESVGGIVGSNSGTITNNTNYGYTTGTAYYVGGIVGSNSGAITNNNNYANTTGTAWYVGGISGYNLGGTTTNNTNYGYTNGTNRVGGIVGYNSGAVINSTNHGNTSGTDDIGGITGYNSGAVTNNNNLGNTTGDEYVGGLVGNNSVTGTITDSYATGDVSSNMRAGGLVGINQGLIDNTYATGDVDATLSYVGGLVGYNGYETDGTTIGLISDSYATGNVTGQQRAGGLVGFNHANIERSYATGDVSANFHIGGLVGRSYESTTVDCYATGDVTATSNTAGGLIGSHVGPAYVDTSYATGTVSCPTAVGGLVGANTGSVNSTVYWDNQTTGQTSTIGGGSGRYTVEMMQELTFTGWDFTNTWDIVEGHSYPYFQITAPDAGQIYNIGKDAYYPSIATALSAATSGDTLLVATGTYVGEVNVPAGVTLSTQGDVTIDGNLVVDSAGDLIIGDGQTFEVTGTQTGNVTISGSSVSMIYPNVELDFTALPGGSHPLSFVDSDGVSGLNGGISRYWAIDSDMVAGTFSVDVTFSYTDADVEHILNEEVLGAYYDDGGGWTLIAGGSLDTGANTLTINGLDHFTDFSLGGGTVITATDGTPPVANNDWENVGILELVIDSTLADTLNDVNVTFNGTDAADVTDVEIWYDVDDDGLFEPLSDTELASATFSDGVARIAVLDHAIGAGTAPRYWVVYDLAGTASHGDVIDGRIEPGDIWLQNAGNTTERIDEVGNVTMSSGMFAPFTVYGIVYDEALSPINITETAQVEIYNVDKDESMFVDTGSDADEGKYMVDLGNYVMGWNNGDTIIARVSNYFGDPISIDAIDTDTVDTSGPYLLNIDLYLDNTAPVPVLTDPADSASITGTHTFLYSAPAGDAVAAEIGYDSGSGWIVLDTDSPADGTIAIDVSGIADGAYTFYVNVTDEVGNYGNDTSVTVEVDNTAPSVTLDTPIASESVNGIYTFTYSAWSGDVDSVDFFYDGNWLGTDNGSIEGTVDLDTSGIDGTYTITIRVGDDVDLTGTDTALTVEIDNTAPTVTLDTPIAAAVIGGSSYTFTYSAWSGDVDSVDFFYDGNWLGTDNGSIEGTVDLDTTVITDGTYTITIRVGDEHDQTGEDTSAGVIVDNTAPTFATSVAIDTDVDADGSIDDGDTIEITVVVTDNNFDGTSTLTVDVDEDVGNDNAVVMSTADNGVTWTGTYVVAGTEFTISNVDVAGTDLAGNSATENDDATYDIAGSYTVSYATGWNIISIPVLNPTYGGGTALDDASDFAAADPAGNVLMVTRWDADTQKYITYIEGFHSIGGLYDYSIGVDEAYWVWYDNAGVGSFDIDGDMPHVRNIGIKTGWNLVGWTCTTNGDASTDIADDVVASAYDAIAWWNPVATSFEYYVFSGDTLTLVPGRGYFVWSDTVTTVNYGS